MVPWRKIKADEAEYGRTASIRRVFWNFRMRDSHACCLLEMNLKSLYYDTGHIVPRRVGKHSRRRVGLMLVPAMRGCFDHIVAVDRHRSDRRDFKARLSRNVPGA
jgi:hypothetical protein